MTINVKRTEIYVKELFKNNEGSHDFFHVNRVRNLALQIAKKENADLEIVELTALLHDVDDFKLGNKGIAKNILGKLNLPKQRKEIILNLTQNISYKGAKVKDKELTIEGKCVQDADRLDAIGAIGIARAFAFGGKLGRPIYNPKIKPGVHKTFSSYKKTHKNGTTINHFYEKLLLLKNKMNTKTGKKIAQEKHEFMVKFLKQFFKEWNN